MFYSPKETYIDIGKGNYIEIGNHVRVTRGVTILAHDWSYSVLNDIYGEMPKKQAKTIIGNNVFIGMNATILMGSAIGNNVIIGAGSVVSGKIPSNTIWAGNPARQICTLEEFYEKRKRSYAESALLQARVIREKCGRNPKIEEMDFFMPLFLAKTEENYQKYFSKLESFSDMPTRIMEIEQQWDSWKAFLDEV